MVSTVKDDDLVLAVAPEELLVGAMGHTFDQNLEDLAHLTLVVLEGYLALQGNDFLQAARLNIVRDIV